MSEGHKAIFRVALALLKEHTTQLCGASDRMDAMDVLCPVRFQLKNNDFLC